MHVHILRASISKNEEDDFDAFLGNILLVFSDFLDFNFTNFNISWVLRRQNYSNANFIYIILGDISNF